MSGIRLDAVTKIYANGVKAVDRVSLDIRLGEFVVLVGPSGCGKSTLLRMIAGLEDVTVGDIYIGDMDVTDRPPQERDIAMVFQNYALYPHMTVRDNLAYGLKLRKMPKSEWRSRVDEVASVLGLSELLDRKPAALSGGQRQRVAMGRAIVRNPKAFLMDEPLSNLDAKLRVSMRAELAKLHERLGVTTVYVTHDQVEAMTLGQRVAVLRDGVLQQVDTPQALFHAPVNLFVAAFIGSPSMNLVEAEIVGDVVRFAGFDLALAAGSSMVGANRSVILGIRPTDFAHADAAPDLPRMRVRIDVVEDLGAESHLIFAIDAPRVSAEAVRAAADLAADDEGKLFANDQRAVFTAVVGAKRATTPGLGDRARGRHRAPPLLRPRHRARRRCGEAGGRVRLRRPSAGHPSMSRLGPALLAARHGPRRGLRLGACVGREGHAVDHRHVDDRRVPRGVRVGRQRDQRRRAGSLAPAGEAAATARAAHPQGKRRRVPPFLRRSGSGRLGERPVRLVVLGGDCVDLTLQFDLDQPVALPGVEKAVEVRIEDAVDLRHHAAHCLLHLLVDRGDASLQHHWPTPPACPVLASPARTRLGQLLGKLLRPPQPSFADPIAGERRSPR